jgi:hypothetical protein
MDIILLELARYYLICLALEGEKERKAGKVPNGLDLAELQCTNQSGSTSFGRPSMKLEALLI